MQLWSLSHELFAIFCQSLEKRNTVSSDFLRRSVSGHVRAILVDWMIQVQVCINRLLNTYGFYVFRMCHRFWKIKALYLVISPSVVHIFLNLLMI